MSGLIPLLLPEDEDARGRRSRRGVERLAGLSAAVVAIAITLVMLPLIELASERDASLGHLFLDDGYRFGAAALSFVVIGAFWREHQEAYVRAEVDSRRLVSLNLVWLAAIVFLPVPTALLLAPTRAAGDERVAVALYAATAAVGGFSMRASEWEIRRNCSGAHEGRRSRWSIAARWSSPVLLSITAVLALEGFGTRALWVLVIAVPLQWISILVARSRRRDRVSRVNGSSRSPSGPCTGDSGGLKPGSRTPSTCRQVEQSR